MTIVLSLALAVAVAAIVILVLDLRATERKLRGEQMRADASSAETHRLRSRLELEKGRRDLAEVGYQDLLTEVAAMATQMEASHGKLAARRLHRLVDDRLGARRRAER